MFIVAVTVESQYVKCYVEETCGGDYEYSNMTDCCDHRYHPPGLAYKDDERCTMCENSKC